MRIFLLICAISLTACASINLMEQSTTMEGISGKTMALPPPSITGKQSLEEMLSLRRSVRSFSSATLTEPELSQLLWAAQGITDSSGKRTAPSAGALYPLEIYVALPNGLFHYEPRLHTLTEHISRDIRKEIYEAGLRQDAILEAPAVFIITAVYERVAVKYGERATRYTHIEVGHAAQNLLLEATALGLGGVPIGAFEDEELSRTLSLPESHAPLYIIPVGHPK